MFSFLSAFATFLLMHSVPALPSARAVLISKLADRRTLWDTQSLQWRPYFGFSLPLSLSTTSRYGSAALAGGVSLCLSAPRRILVVAGLLSRNALSISLARRTKSMRSWAYETSSSYGDSLSGPVPYYR